MPTPSEKPFAHKFALVLTLTLAESATAQIERQHGAHVHGASIVDIALDGKSLSIHLDAPGMNLLGFENPPRDAAERATVAAVLKDLNAPAAWLKPAPAAECRLIAAKVESKGLGNGAAAGGETHADFDADYSFECAQADKLGDIDIQLVARYAGTKIVTVNIASAIGQTTTELTGATSKAIFPR